MSVMPSLAADLQRPTPWRAGVLSVLLASTVVVGFLFHQAYAPLVAISGLVLVPFIRHTRTQLISAILLALLVAWTCLSSRWSPAQPSAGHGWHSSMTALKIFALLAFSIALAASAAGISAPGGRRVSIIAAVAVLILSGILLLESLMKGGIYGAVRHATGEAITPDIAAIRSAMVGDTVAMLMFPAALTLAMLGQVRWLLLLAVSVIAAHFTLSADAQMVAIVVGALAFGLWRFTGRIAMWIGIVGQGVYWLFTPFAFLAAEHAGLSGWAHAHLGASWSARVDIWLFAAARIHEKPLIGWGLDASRTWPGIIPLHTHDAAMQIWLELGAVGAILAALFTGWLIWCVGRMDDDRPMASAAFASIASYLFIGAVSFGVWQEWWIALGAIGFCAVLVLRRWRLGEQFAA